METIERKEWSNAVDRFPEEAQQLVRKKLLKEISDEAYWNGVEQLKDQARRQTIRDRLEVILTRK